MAAHHFPHKGDHPHFPHHNLSNLSNLSNLPIVHPQAPPAHVPPPPPSVAPPNPQPPTQQPKVSNFTCGECGKVLSNAFNLSRHVKLKHNPNNPMYNCPHCPKSFKDEDYLIGHIKGLHELDDAYKCTECGKRFGSIKHVQGHMRVVHSDLTPYECEYCGRKFKGKQRRDGHVQNFHITNEHERKHETCCRECGKNFVTHFQLKKHFKAVHELKQEPSASLDTDTEETKEEKRLKYEPKHCESQCEQCGVWCFSKADLTKHIQIAHYEKNIMCSLCGKMFSIKSFLHRHMVQVHNVRSEKSFVANIKDKRNLPRKKPGPKKKPKPPKPVTDDSGDNSEGEDKDFVPRIKKKHRGKKRKVVFDDDGQGGEVRVKTEQEDYNNGDGVSNFDTGYFVSGDDEDVEETEEKFDPRSLVKVGRSKMVQCMTCDNWYDESECHARRLFADQDLVRNCNKCDRLFGREGMLSTHVERVRLFRIHYCTECCKCFESESQLSQHVDDSHDHDEEEEEDLDLRLKWTSTVNWQVFMPAFPKKRPGPKSKTVQKSQDST